MRIPKKLLADLKAIREKLGGLDGGPMTGHFDTIGSDAGRDFPKSEKDVNAFISERTRLWRRSWIIPGLNDLIEWAENKPK